jgi:hypothetical protein
MDKFAASMADWPLLDAGEDDWDGSQRENSQGAIVLALSENRGDRLSIK